MSEPLRSEDIGVLRAGWGYANIGDKISDLVLTRPVRWPWLAAFLGTLAGTLVLLGAAIVHLPVPHGGRHLGHQRARGLGLRHCQLRVVDRHRPCGHLHLGRAAAAAADGGARRSTASPKR
jgi:hypothetical protein